MGDELLHRRHYLIRTRFDPERNIDVYAITDPDTGTALGLGAERPPGRAARRLRTWFGRNLLLSEVWMHDAVSGRRSFSVQELPNAWCPRVLISDGAGARFCALHGRFAFIGGGFLARDRAGHFLGRLEAEHQGAPYQFVGRDGRSLGAILERADISARSDAEWAERYAVAVSDAAEDAEAARLLMLGCALALDIVYRERV